LDLFLIGIGTGNPAHLTGEARATLRAADLILIPRKGPEKSDLAGLRHLILAQVFDGAVPLRIAEFDMPARGADAGYRAGVEDWHDAIAARWQAAIAAASPAPRKVALMVWGDPMLYDSTLRIAARLPGMKVRVVPGITAIQALCAAHAIPLNLVGEPVLITTGRQLRDHGWPASAPDTMVVMLDGECSFQTLPPEGITIWWGAFLGMEEEILHHGPLPQVAPEIALRREAARAAHGWIMDIYLLRRTLAAG
jgi:precorrin-6A synthase